MNMGFPETTEAALTVANHLSAPTHVRIWVNKQYPEILAYCFDGSAFGAQPVSADRPTMDTAKAHAQHATKLDHDLQDDDIPF